MTPKKFEVLSDLSIVYSTRFHVVFFPVHRLIDEEKGSKRASHLIRITASFETNQTCYVVC